MTAYFDKKHKEIRDASVLERAPLDQDDEMRLWGKASQLLDKVEKTLVFDCTVAAEWPGFPEALRDQVHAVVVTRAISCLPINAKVRPFIDTLEQQVERLHVLCWDLHTIFHDVSQHPGFSDDPRFPLRALFTLGEERREELVARAEAEPPEELP